MTRGLRALSLLLVVSLGGPAVADAPVTPADLDRAADGAEGAASAPSPSGASGGSLGIPSSAPAGTLGAQSAIAAFNQASSFAAKIGRVGLESWCAFEGIGDLSALDIPTLVDDPARNAPASLATRMYQSLGGRFSFGPGVGESLRDHDADGDVSSCCSLRESVLASPILDEDRQLCTSTPSDACVLEKKLTRMHLSDKRKKCTDVGVPLDGPAACTAADIMTLRATRNTGIRATIGARVQHTNDVAKDSTKGWGVAAEFQLQYAAPKWFVFASGAVIALQAWQEVAGEKVITHAGLVATQLSAGAQLRRQDISLAISAALTRNRWSDTLPTDKLNATRGDLAVQVAYMFASSISGSLQISATKPAEADWSFNDAKLGVAFGPSVAVRY